MWCWIKSSFVDLDGWQNGWFWFVWSEFLRGDYVKDPKTGKQQAVKSPNEHGNTLGNQPAERYKLIDKKTNKPLKSGETTLGELRYGVGKQRRYTRKELPQSKNRN